MIPTSDDIGIQRENAIELKERLRRLAVLGKVAYEDLADKPGIENIKREYQAAVNCVEFLQQALRSWERIAETHENGRNDHKYKLEASFDERITELQEAKKLLFGLKEGKGEAENDG